MHDLPQHEKMIECLRKSYADLSDCHVVLSRSLDAVVKHHFIVNEELLLYKEDGSFQVNLYGDTFRALSMYPYCKKILVYIVL